LIKIIVSLRIVVPCLLCEGEVVEYMQLKPHILSTPVIDDFNSDGITEELLVPVSYYLDDVFGDVDT